MAETRTLYWHRCTRCMQKFKSPFKKKSCVFCGGVVEVEDSVNEDIENPPDVDMEVRDEEG